MKKLITLLAVLSFFSLTAQINTGTIKGIITDSNNNDPVPFANITLLSDSQKVIDATSDFDGKYTLKPIPPGTYDLQLSYVGYQTKKISGIIVKAGKIIEQNMSLSAGVELKSVEIISYRKPLFERDQTTRGSRINVRGSRRGSNVTFIDGVKIIGSTYEEPYPYPNQGELYQEINDNDFKMANHTPLSTFSIDVDKASYANTRRYINDGHLPPVSAVRIEEMINYFNYDYPQPSDEHPFSITTEFSNCPWNDQRKLALIGIQGKTMDMAEAPKSNLVFLIDVSGSMGSYDKLGLLKEGFHLLIDQLREEDRVAIVVYAGAAGLVLPSTSGKNKDKIRNVLNSLGAGGSTAGGQGIKLAYHIAQKHFKKEGNNRVILATDGDFNVGVSDQKELVKLIEEEREKGVFLSVLGFGSGNLQDYKMEQIADKGNGNYNYIDNILEAKKVLVNEMSGTLFTIAKDVKVQAEFNPAKVKAYRLIGYVNRHLEDEDFNDDKKDAGELGAGHSVTVLYEIIPADSEEKIKDIDPLKYQKQSPNDEQFGEEILTVKFRYKEPDGKQSILLSKAMSDEKVELENASANLQFSAAVASFGMLLRGSESVDDLEFKDVAKMAKRSKGEDDEGYRSEFIRLVETAELLK